MLVMARKPDPPPRVSRITTPEVCHPVVKVVFAEMRRQSITYDELEYRSGVLKSTFKAWRTNNRPGLETVEAALGALGWSFLPVPSLEHVPAKIRVELERLAKEWGDEDKLLLALLSGVARSAAIEARKYRLFEKKARVRPDETPEEAESRKAKVAAYHRRWYLEKKALQSPEELERTRSKARERYYRVKQLRAKTESPEQTAERRAREREYARAYYRSRNPRNDEEIHA